VGSLAFSNNAVSKSLSFGERRSIISCVNFIVSTTELCASAQIRFSDESTMRLPSPPPRLVMAATIGDLPRVKQFLKEGDDINQLGPYGESPLLAAADAGHDAIVDYLLASKASLPSEEDIAAIPSPSIRSRIASFVKWKAESRGLAEFSSAAAAPSLSTPTAPITKLNRDVVGTIASYLRPSGTVPKGRRKTAGKRRRSRKQPRRRK
jgi:ankyrin repeat protein